MGCCGGKHHHNMGLERSGSHGQHGQQGMEGHRYAGSGGQYSNQPAALDLVKERLAKGEITPDEYQQIYQVLSS